MTCGLSNGAIANDRVSNIAALFLEFYNVRFSTADQSYSIRLPLKCRNAVKYPMPWSMAIVKPILEVLLPAINCNNQGGKQRHANQKLNFLKGTLTVFSHSYDNTLSSWFKTEMWAYERKQSDVLSTKDG